MVQMTKVLSLFCVPAVLLLSACGSAGRLPSQKTENPKDEVVDVGYGSTTREGLGFAVNTVKVDEMAVRSYESISDYIRSRVPGVEINPNGTLRIRGTQALVGYSSPLIVVADVICDNINMVNPNQIHSVQVLKDGSASIYGSRGGNGVILIKTKMAYETEQAQIAARKAEKEAKKAAKKKKG